MHRCVCIWRYILQNYNYKPHFQYLFIYHIPHVSIGTLAAKNLDVCTACDPWDSNIQLTMVNDRRPGPGMSFLTATHVQRGGGLFISARVFFPVWRHPWMDDRTYGWMKKASRPWLPLLYVMSSYKKGVLCSKVFNHFWTSPSSSLDLLLVHGIDHHILSTFWKNLHVEFLGKNPHPIWMDVLLPTLDSMTSTNQAPPWLSSIILLLKP